MLALPASNLKQLMPEFEQIRCHRGQILMDADSSLDHVFFPDSGVVSVVAVYANGSIIEMATIKQRLARWLLMMRDRGDDDTLQITQDLLAEMLGVQRPTITNAARELE
ncbi:MAG TPA: helix-turn-helix domain-containing protein [Stellaceae bacterium]|nr:helix-turn-helix domain-containing protein [Stellaceae bacterium]